jgi:hypothetical protein
MASMTSSTPLTYARPIPTKRLRGNYTIKPVTAQWNGESSAGAGKSPVAEIAHKMRNPSVRRPERKFMPVHDVESYVNALIYHGLSEDQAEVVRREHMEALAKFDRPLSEKKKELNVPRILQPVNALLEVTGDKVKLILSTSMWKMQEEYFNKGKRPPLGKYVRAISNANYPPESVTKMIKQYNWMETWGGDAYDEEFERLFPTTGSKKSTVVKKATKAVKKF